MVTIMMQLNREMQECNPARAVRFKRYAAMGKPPSPFVYKDTGNAPGAKTPER